MLKFVTTLNDGFPAYTPRRKVDFFLGWQTTPMGSPLLIASRKKVEVFAALVLEDCGETQMTRTFFGPIGSRYIYLTKFLRLSQAVW